MARSMRPAGRPGWARCPVAGAPPGRRRGGCVRRCRCAGGDGVQFILEQYRGTDGQCVVGGEAVWHARVFAAASLNAAFDKVSVHFEKAKPGVTVKFSR